MTFDYLTNTTGIFSIATYVNTVTENMFWTFMLIAVFLTVLIAFMISPNIRNEDALIGASFIGLLISVLLKVMGLINNSIIFIMVVLLSIGIVLAHLSSTRVTY